MTEFQEMIQQARDSMTVKRVFGEPYQQNGVTIIPAAKIRGGAGGGVGTDAKQSRGFGGGYGVMASPVGTYVIKGDTVRWLPAVDVNRLVLIAAFITIFALGTVRSVVRTLAKGS